MSASAKVRGRVIAAGPHGEIDDLIEIDPAAVAGLAGAVDCSPGAVAYAEKVQADKAAAAAGGAQ